MKAILVVDVPKNFKKGRADCLIYEDKKPYRMWNRIIQVKPMPQKKTIDHVKMVTEATWWEEGYNACIDEILGEEE